MHALYAISIIFITITVFLVINDWCVNINFHGYKMCMVVVVKSELYNKIMCTCIAGKSNLWSTSRMVRQRVIDNYGKFYDVQYVDLNRDGRPDVLTTTVK